MPATVAAYFQAKLGEALEAEPVPQHEYSPSHPGFHIETGCGNDCRILIDTAAVAINQHGANRSSMTEYARNEVLAYVYG